MKRVLADLLAYTQRDEARTWLIACTVASVLFVLFTPTDAFAFFDTWNVAGLKALALGHTFFLTVAAIAGIVLAIMGLAGRMSFFQGIVIWVLAVAFGAGVERAVATYAV
jgi:hypothetical protein